MFPRSDHEPGPPGSAFAAALRLYRLAAGLTQEELAIRSGLGVRTLRDLERGSALRPQRGTVALLAEALRLVGAARETFFAAAAAARASSPRRGVSRRETARRDLGSPGAVRGDPGRLGDSAPVGRSGSGPVGPVGPGVEPPPGSPLAAQPDLIGRAGDLRELEELLELTDLISLVGSAGVGKTCLALTVAHRAQTRPDARPVGAFGVVDVSGRDDILGCVAAVFGVARADDLGGRLTVPSLLVLDGVDRAAHASAEAIRWLRVRVPAMKILATSRLSLQLPGCVDWRLDPLDVPPPDAPVELAALRRYPSVVLFLTRLRQVRREPVRDSEAAALAGLVRRLGGLPLAIELAAARGRVLGVAELLDRYGNGPLDLGSPDRVPGAPGITAPVVSAPGITAPVVSAPGILREGQRLRDAVVASYRLLNGDEQFALRRLSVFRGRWSIELAEALLADRPDLVVATVVDRLVGLGLVGVHRSRDLRFRLLDVVSDLAAEECAVAGERATARLRHAEVFASLAERVAPHLIGTDFSRAVARLDHLNGDIRAALGYASLRDPRTALRLASAITRWCRFRGRDREACALLRRLLDDDRTAGVDPVSRAWAQLSVSMLAAAHGAGLAELAATGTALEVMLHHGEVGGELTARAMLGDQWRAIGEYGKAREHDEAMLALASRTDRLRDVAVAHNNLAWQDIRTGDLAAATRRLTTAAQCAVEAGDVRVRALAHANLAEVARLDRRYSEAVELATSAAAGLVGLGDPGHRIRVLGTLGQAMAQAGRVDEALAVLAELAPPGADGAAAPSVGALTGVAARPGVGALTGVAAGVASMIAAYVALAGGDRSAAAGRFADAANRLAGRLDARHVVEALVGVAASVEEPVDRETAVAKLAAVCDHGGLVLLPRDRTLLGRRPATVRSGTGALRAPRPQSRPLAPQPASPTK